MFAFTALILLYSLSFHHAQPGDQQDEPLEVPAPDDDHDRQQVQPGGPSDGDQSHEHSSMWAINPDQSALLDANEYSYLVENAEFDEMNLEIISGNKKDSVWIVINNQYICVKNDESLSGSSFYWECRTRRITGCPFKLQTEVDSEGKHSIVYMYSMDRHTCYQDSIDVYEQKFRNAVKGQMALDYRSMYASIYDRAKAEILQSIMDINLRERVRLALPSRARLRSAANAARRLPTAPKSFEDIDLTILNDEKIDISRYIIAEDKNEGILIFGTLELAKEFSNSIFKSADATFKICPKMFYQVLIFLAMVGGVYVTCMFAVMPNKTGNSYKKVFSMIFETFTNFGLDTEWRNHYFMMDFEIAMRNGVRSIFPNIRLIGCYFHFSQQIVKRMRKAGFQTSYSKNEKFNAFIRRVCSLPLVPTKFLSHVMTILFRRAEDCFESDERLGGFCRNLLEYVQSTWTNGVFSVQDWNLFDSDCQIIPTTNNGNESENARLNVLFATHPQLYRFVLQVIEELDKTKIKLLDILDGKIRRKQKETYKELQVEREASKKILLERTDIPNISEAEIIENLDRYMGAIGASAAKIANQKVSSDYVQEDFIFEDHIDNGGQVFTHNGNLTILVSEQNTMTVSDHSQPGQSQVRGGGRGRGRGRGRGGRGQGPVLRGEPPKKNARKELEALSYITLLSSQSSEDSLYDHISKHDLKLKKHGYVPANGDCFYVSIYNLLELFQHPILVKVSDALELRRLIVSHIPNHPQFKTWLEMIWKSQMRKFKDFAENHMNHGVFTDNYGIVLYTTINLLEVNINVVSSSNNEKNPITKFECPAGSKLDFFLGYHQDTTDVGGVHARAGHYESLREFEPEEEEMPFNIRGDEAEEVMKAETIKAMKAEEEILKMLGRNDFIVQGSISRLEALQVTADHLLQSELCSVLMAHVYPLHDSTSVAGKMVRKLLKKYETICKEVEGYNGDPLDITICDDTIGEVIPEQPKKTFRNLFQRREVTIPSDATEVTVEESIVETVEESSVSDCANYNYQERLSLTGNTSNFGEVIAESTRVSNNDFNLQKRARRNHNVDEDESLVNHSRRRRLAEAAAYTTSSSIFLTPPPPVSPATPPRRGRGRPRKRQLEEMEDTLIPKAKKKPGRPCKTVHEAPDKKGRGRPKKN